MKKLLSLILLLSFTIKAQEIKIGTQTWTTKNLDVSKFRNGEAIPLAKTNAEWKSAGENLQPAWCYYENKGENGIKYGKLYNWYAVNDPRGLAPNGYHIPSDAEWTILTDYLGGDSIAGAKMKSTSGWKHKTLLGEIPGGTSEAGTKMKSMSGWKHNGNDTNTSGFAGLPGGSRFGTGIFTSIGGGGYWWSSSERSTDYTWFRELFISNGNVIRSYYNKRGGFSVLCVKE